MICDSEQEILKLEKKIYVNMKQRSVIYINYIEIT